MKSKQQLLRLLLEKIYQYDVISKVRKIADGIAANIRRLRIVERRKMVGDINDIKIWIDLQKLSLNGTYQVVLLTYIGYKGY